MCCRSRKAKMPGNSVHLYIYDLSKGMAQAMSQALIGKRIEGVWHTSITVFDMEIFYGGGGIESCQPGGTVLGQPDKTVDLGPTEIPFAIIMEHLEELSRTSFRGTRYHLFNYNCNTFSDEFAQFLTGKSIPSYITSLPQDILETPFGSMLKPFVDAMSAGPQGGQSMFPETSQARSAVLPGKEASFPSSSSAAASSSTVSPECKKRRALIFERKEILSTFSTLENSLKKCMQPKQYKVLCEVKEFLSTPECTWSLGIEHLKVLAKLIGSGELAIEQRLIVSNLLELSVLKEDVIHLMKMDKDRHLINMMYDLGAKDPRLQCSLLRVLSNCFQHKVGSDWMISTQPLPIVGKEVSSNVKFISKICSNGLLLDKVEVSALSATLAVNITRASDTLPEDQLIEIGTALIQRLLGTVKDEAMVQYLEALHRCMRQTEQVVGLASVMGLDMTKYKSLEGHCGKLSSLIDEKMQTMQFD